VESLLVSQGHGLGTIYGESVDSEARLRAGWPYGGWSIPEFRWRATAGLKLLGSALSGQRLAYAAGKSREASEAFNRMLKRLDGEAAPSDEAKPAPGARPGWR
jgi:hypothetical protein